MNTEHPLSDKRVIIFAGPDFEDMELMYPKFRFLEAGAEVKVAGLGDPMYTGKKGYPITVDGNAEEFVVGHWDMVVIPGGWAPDKMRLNNAMLEIVRRAIQNECTVGAICHGGWVLASADVLKNRTATSYIAIKDDMVNAGATWVDEPVVIDGPLVTSRTPDDLPEFCKALISTVLHKQPAMV